MTETLAVPLICGPRGPLPEGGGDGLSVGRRQVGLEEPRKELIDAEPRTLRGWSPEARVLEGSVMTFGRDGGWNIGGGARHARVVVVRSVLPWECRVTSGAMARRSALRPCPLRAEVSTPSGGVVASERGDGR